jgi:hypothetical protein
MLRSIPILALCLIVASNIYGQQITPQVVTAVGATLNQGDNQLTFTIGEIAVKSISDNNNSIGQGFINSAATTTILSIQSNPAAFTSINAYPNPFNTFITLDIVKCKSPLIHVLIYNSSGALVSTDKYLTNSNTTFNISTVSWVPDTYVLKIQDEFGNIICIYKIIKS